MYYIKEIDKLNIFDKIFLRVKDVQNKFDNNCSEILLPNDCFTICKNSKTGKNKTKKLVRKIVNIVKKSECNKVILSSDIANNELFANYIYSYGLDVINGKWLFEILSDNIIAYIINKKRFNKDEIYISILVNDISSIMLENIKSIILKYKKVNIITKHIEKFKNIEEDILIDIGKSVYISNNKRKGLIKSNIILNVDFSEEEINKYNIYDEAIVVNLKQNVKINRKRFRGININDYEIKYIDTELDLQELSLDYRMKEVYESKLSKKMLCQEVFQKIEKNFVEIEYLQGDNIRI